MLLLASLDDGVPLKAAGEVLGERGDAVDEGKEERREDEGQVDQRVPHELFAGILLDVEEDLQQVDRGDRHDGASACEPAVNTLAGRRPAADAARRVRPDGLRTRAGARDDQRAAALDVVYDQRSVVLRHAVRMKKLVSQVCQSRCVTKR